MARRGKARDDACGSTVTSPGVREIGVSASPWVEFTLGEPQRAGFARLRTSGELGRGGMGVVFKAHQVALNRRGRPQDDQVGRFRHGSRAGAVSKRGRGRRAARPSSHRADLRGRPAPGAAFFQHEADRRGTASTSGSPISPPNPARRLNLSPSLPRRFTMPINAASFIAT